MSDLPSRQWFRDHAGVMLNDTDEEGMEEWAIVAAYASGRLVDRETIDYAAEIYEWFDGQSLFAAWSDSQVKGYALALAAALADSR